MNTYNRQTGRRLKKIALQFPLILRANCYNMRSRRSGNFESAFMCQNRFMPLVVSLVSLALVACGGGEGSVGNSPAPLFRGDIAIAYVKRPAQAIGNPIDAISDATGGDLFIRDLSSPSAQERNITSSHTLGTGDVSDPEVSFDGERIVFSMRGPNDRTWNVWEYDRLLDRLRRVIADDAQADLGDDVDPAYLPDGRLVFSSNRQTTTKNQLAAKNIEPFAYRDELGREKASVLHTMTATGEDIRQISFNQSHDRNPTILRSGEIMYSRWENAGARNQYSLFYTNPDGTGMFILYGAHSPGDGFLHAREMEDGRVISTLVPMGSTREGGALVIADVANYSDYNRPAAGAPVTGETQHQPTLFEVPLDNSVSPYGRYTTPYPLWDGTNRVLVSWSPLQAEQALHPYTGETETVEGAPKYGIYMLNLADRSLRPVVTAPPGFVVTDPIPLQPRANPNIIEDKTLNPTLRARNKGIFNIKSVYDTDQLGLMGDTVFAGDETVPTMTPTFADTRNIVADIARLKDPQITPASARPARFLRVTKAVPTPPGLGRQFVGETPFAMQEILGYIEVEPDGSAKFEAPADTAVAFTVVDREGRSFTPMSHWLQVRPGETRTCNGCHSPRRGSALNSDPIAGNHPDLFGVDDSTLIHVHPGASANSRLIAVDPQGDALVYRIVDAPRFGVAVITDANTGAFTYTANIDAPIGRDTFTWVANDGVEDSNLATITVNIHPTPAATRGESMAETRARTFPEKGLLVPDLVYFDVWGQRTNPCIIIRYTNNTDCAEAPQPEQDLATTAPVGGVINYRTQIQPLWVRNRGANTCTNCHNANQPTTSNPSGLNLGIAFNTAGVLTSYLELLKTSPERDATGLPNVVIIDNEVTIARGTPSVIPGASRHSALTEVLFGVELRADRPLIATVDHSSFLNRAEKRLVVEWIDIGAQYYNDPFVGDQNNNGTKELSEVRGSITTLDVGQFMTVVQPMLVKRCAGCHRPTSVRDDTSPVGSSTASATRANPFILTGRFDGDFNATAGFITSLSAPFASDLVAYAASNGLAPNPTHPQVPSQLTPGTRTPVLSAQMPVDATATADYQALVQWIDAARSASGL